MNTKLVVAITTLLLSTANARSQGVVDIEFLPRASGFENAIGVGFYQMKEYGFGFFGNFQSTLTQREPMYENLTVASYGDPVTQRYKDLTIGNIGITKKFTQNFGAYAGIGYASASGVARKYDPLHILGSGGTYYVNDPGNDKSGANINAGIIINLEKLAFNFGYNSFTKSAFFGIGSRF